MSEYADKHRTEAAKDRVKRLTGKHNEGDVDASGWKEPTDEKAAVQTGMRPVSKRQFKKGGEVHGEHAHHHAGRKARASGGEIADAMMNRNQKAANEKRAGEKHDGGLKRGGRPKRASGGIDVPTPQNAGPIGGGLYGMKSNPVRSPLLKDGGKAERKGRASGGKVSKGKTNINIIIGGGRDKEAASPMPPMAPPMGPPPGSPMVPPPAPPPGAMPPGMPPRGP